MASKAAKAKHKKQIRKINGGTKHFSSVKFVHRCEICGRSRGYIRRFKMCRICFREHALAGKLPGVKKISW